MAFKPLLIVLAFMLAIPNFINKDINEDLPYNNKERYHPSLSIINSIDKLESFVDAVATSHQIAIKSEAYPPLLSYIISCRFYHGFSHYKLNENWICAAGEKIIGQGLSCLVDPDAIMKNGHAACSQQAIVMMEILKRKKIDYRKVGFPHHYALEVKAGGRWFYFDPNMEPKMSLSQRLHENWKESNDSLIKYYDQTKHDNISYQFGVGQKAIFGIINEQPARRISLFQKVTRIISKILWAFPLALYFILSYKALVNRKKAIYSAGVRQNLRPVLSS